MKFIPNKKILLIIGFAVLVIILSWLIYLVFFQPNYAPQNTLNTDQTGQGLSSAGNGQASNTLQPSSGQLTPAGETATNLTSSAASPFANGGLTQVGTINNQKVLGIFSLNGQVSYYQPSDGKFYQVSSNGTITAISDKVFNQVSQVDWSPTGSKAILEYPDGSKIVYDFTSQKQVTLPKHWQDFSWSPSGDQIAAKSLGSDPDNRFLIVSNADGSQAKIIDSLGENDDIIKIDWSPNQQIVAQYTRSDGAERQRLYFIGLNKENYKSTVVSGRGLKTQWSTDGSSILYSTYSSETNYSPTLWLAAGQPASLGSWRSQLNVKTSADKCTFADEQTVYCAVPTTMPANSGLLPELLNNVPDKLQKIDLTNGKITDVALPEGSHTISKLTVSIETNSLYFTDSNQTGLFEIKLK